MSTDNIPDNLRTALILAYDFPPYNSIGAQRPYAWFKYFREFGLYPVIVTRHWDVEIKGPDDCSLPSQNDSVTITDSENGRIVRAPFRPTLRDRLISRHDPVSVLFRKVLSIWQLLTEHHLRCSDNKSTIFDAAQNYLQNHQVDVIVACGEPFVLFSYAARLSRSFGIPWVGDYRDGWSTNYRWDEGGLYAWIQKKVQRPVEKKAIATASALTVAAPDFSRRIAALLNHDAASVPVIYNGYFEEKFEQTGSIELKPVFTLAHAGTLYYFQRVETLLAGLNLFRNAHPDTEFDVVFYGLNFYPSEIGRIRAASGKVDVRFVDRLPHDEMLRDLSQAHVQLLLATPEKAQIYAKVFDYMATGRPILMTENDHGPLEEMLKDRPNATICSSAEDVAASMERYTSDPSSLLTINNKDSTFTRRNQTGRMANVILSALKHNR